MRSIVSKIFPAHLFLGIAMAAALLLGVAVPGRADFSTGFSLAPQSSESRQAQLTAALNFNQLPQGQQAIAALQLVIAPGFHVPAHQPGASGLIPFDIKIDDVPGIHFLPPVYPAGINAEYPQFGMVNQFRGTVTAYLPFVVSPGAALGKAEISGTLRYQYCNDQTCYLVRAQAFSIAAPIVPAAVAATPQHAEMFAQFDPRVFSTDAGSAGAATPDATAPASASIDLFGRDITLAGNGYLAAMGLAVIVGLLFNLMPCVLPVLPLKAIGFYEVSQHRRGRCLFLGVIFSVGLLAVFAVLASLLFLVPVRFRLGWGEQFSNPWFAWTLVGILVVMALGMFGAFTVLLPTAVYRITPRHDTISGNFLFGMLTAVLSTPCTAPMFAGLLAWAATQPRGLAVAVVMLVGAGMALPYLILSAFPQLANRVPRSGPWSELLKQMLGFLLLAVAVYFAGGRLVAGVQFFWGVFAVIAAAAVFLIVRTLQIAPRPGAAVTSGILAALMLGAGLYVTLQVTRPGVHWTEYSPEAVAAARDAGRPVLVDFTANWCSNCLTIEGTVYKDPRVIKALDAHHVLTLRADLTNPSAPGWPLLMQLNAAGGIPLTALYFPGKTSPVTLSSIYSSGNLIDTLNRNTAPQNPTAASANLSD